MPVLVLMAFLAGPAGAHNVSQSDSKIEIQGREVRVVLTLNEKELQGDAAVTGGGIEPVYETVRQHFLVTDPAVPVETKLETCSVPGGPLLRLRILYVFARDVTTLDVDSTLYRVMPAGHRHLMSVRLNGVLHEAILDLHTGRATFTGVKAANWQTL